MREVTRHSPGKLFIFVLLASLVFTVMIMPFLFEPNTIFWGWLTVPLLCGAVLMIIWLISIAIYVGAFWPYR